MTKEEIIKKAIPVLVKIDKMCPNGKKERDEVFFKLDGLCSKNKRSLLALAGKVIDKTEINCPKTKPHCDTLRGLLKEAGSVKCGGS